MIPLAVNPKLVVLIQDGQVTKHATNVAPDLEVITTDNPAAFAEAIRGVTFVTEVKQ